MFEPQKHTTLDKSFEIKGLHGVTLTVDYDDVNHEYVDFAVKVLCQVLNENWSRDEYIMLHEFERELSDKYNEED